MGEYNGGVTRNAYTRWFRERYPDFPKKNDDETFYEYLRRRQAWEIEHDLYFWDVRLTEEFENSHYFNGVDWVAYDEWPQMNVG